MTRTTSGPAAPRSYRTLRDGSLEGGRIVDGPCGAPYLATLNHGVCPQWKEAR